MPSLNLIFKLFKKVKNKSNNFRGQCLQSLCISAYRRLQDSHAMLQLWHDAGWSTIDPSDVTTAMLHRHKVWIAAMTVQKIEWEFERLEMKWFHVNYGLQKPFRMNTVSQAISLQKSVATSKIRTLTWNVDKISTISFLFDLQVCVPEASWNISIVLAVQIKYGLWPKNVGQRLLALNVRSYQEVNPCKS